jgi:predicted ABC-type ATPase
MPHLIIIAGPNGAGKSTAAPALLKDAAKGGNDPMLIEQDHVWQHIVETSHDR